MFFVLVFPFVEQCDVVGTGWEHQSESRKDCEKVGEQVNDGGSVSASDGGSANANANGGGSVNANVNGSENVDVNELGGWNQSGLENAPEADPERWNSSLARLHHGPS